MVLGEDSHLLRSASVLFDDDDADEPGVESWLGWSVEACLSRNGWGFGGKGCEKVPPIDPEEPPEELWSSMDGFRSRSLFEK